MSSLYKLIKHVPVNPNQTIVVDRQAVFNLLLTGSAVLTQRKTLLTAQILEGCDISRTLFVYEPVLGIPTNLKIDKYRPRRLDLPEMTMLLLQLSGTYNFLISPPALYTDAETIRLITLAQLFLSARNKDKRTLKKVYDVKIESKRIRKESRLLFRADTTQTKYMEEWVRLHNTLLYADNGWEFKALMDLSLYIWHGVQHAKRYI